MATENMSVTPCPGCGQKVRFPTDRGFIKFKCPACSAGLEWGTPPAEPDVMDVVIEGEPPAQNIPTHDTTASFYDALKTAPPIPQAAQQTGQKQQQAEQQQASHNTHAHKPRLLALLYIAGSLAAGYGSYWFDKNIGDNTLYFLLFAACLVLTYYLFFRAIRVATRFGVGSSIAVLFLLAVTLPFAMPYLQELDIGSIENPFEPDELAEGHFKGASKKTTPSEMDDLMEDW